ncbi:MAG: hypothetical protein ACI4ES_11840 [Roseburia sp.]
MIRMILREYRMSIHLEKLKNLFEKKTFNFYFTCLNMYILITMIWGKTQEWKEKPVVMILLILCYASIIWGVMIACLFQNQLPEIMFLLPLEKSERKKYVITAYWIRVISGCIPLCVLHLILVVMKEIHIIQALSAVWVGFLIFAKGNFDLEWVDNSILYRTVKRGLFGYGIWNAIAEGINMTGYMIIHVLSGGKTFFVDWFTVVLGIVLPTLFGMGSFYYWKPAMELAQNFEVIQLAESTSNRKRKWKTYVG